MSPSSRRAWIEIVTGGVGGTLGTVALLAEGVDRNMYTRVFVHVNISRPPRGGRG